MSFKQLLIPAAGLVALGGCNTASSHLGSEDPRLGEAAKYDLAIQTINPDPVYAPNGARPGDDAAKAAAASKRYRTDAVKAVEDIKTSRSATSGGGSK